MSLLKMLEPRTDEPEEIIIDELDSVLDMTFIMEGKVHVGFVLNKTFYNTVALSRGKIMGAYECINCTKSKFMYQAANRVQGYFIRRKNVKILQDEFWEIFSIFSEKLTRYYFEKVHVPITKDRRKQLEEFRAKYPQMEIVAMQEAHSYTT